MMEATIWDPKAISTKPQATAAADPPEDPSCMRVRS